MTSQWQLAAGLTARRLARSAELQAADRLRAAINSGKRATTAAEASYAAPGLTRPALYYSWVALTAVGTGAENNAARL